MVDGQQFNSMKTVPMAEWMRQNEEVYHLDRHVIFKSNIQVAKDRFNQSKGKLVSNAHTHITLVLGKKIDFRIEI